MKIWSLKTNEKSLKLTIHNDNQINIFNEHFRGERMVEWWSPLNLEMYKKGVHRDFMYLTPAVPVLSDKAVDYLSSIIDRYVEFLDAYVVNLDDIKIKLVNVTKVVNCIDYERSSLKYSPSGVVNGFDTLFLNKDKIKDYLIFKIPEFANNRVFVTDEFRNTLINSKLKGFDFLEICDLDVTVEQEKEWQQQYEEALAAIEACKGPTVEWAEAVKKVEEGRAMASGTWKLQADATGNLLIGSLVGGGEYSWTDPIYLPPVLLSLQWHEVDRSEM